MEARFVKGDPQWADYTPGSDLAAGTVVPIGAGAVGILHSPGKNGVEMGIAVDDGVYEVMLGASLAEHALVDWNDTTNKVVAAAGGLFFGRIEPGNGGADTNLRRVRHMATKP
jgi:hypothetical protein